jgi:hypothetical protein
MSTQNIPEWQTKILSMLNSPVIIDDAKVKYAKLIWCKKYNHKSNKTEKIFITKYIRISKIIHITKVFRYINENYEKNIFSFNEKNIRFLKVMKTKREILLADLNNFLKTMKLSKSQKKRVLLAQKILNIQNPNMCNEIGNVLNKLFIKDVALNICEYI